MAANVLLMVAALVMLAGVLPSALRLIGNGTLAAMIAFVGVGITAGHLLGGPVDRDRTMLALSASTRHPAIALAIAKAGGPQEPLLAAAIVLYFLVSFACAIPYQRWCRRRMLG